MSLPWHRYQVWTAGLVIAAAVTVLAALVLSQSRVKIEGPLEGLDQGGAGVVNSIAGSKPVWHYGSWPICLRDADSVTLDAIAPKVVGDLTVTAVGVRALDTNHLTGSAPGPIPGSFRPVARFTVTGDCRSTSGAEVALELRPGHGPGAVNGFTVRYHQGRNHFALDYPAVIVLCHGAEPNPTNNPVLDLCIEAGQ